MPDRHRRLGYGRNAGRHSRSRLVNNRSPRARRTPVREGNNIYLELPVTLSEAILGARINVPTPTGSVTMTVPKGSNTGTVLRLRGKGVPRRNGGHGDELLKLKVCVPKTQTRT